VVDEPLGLFVFAIVLGGTWSTDGLKKVLGAIIASLVLGFVGGLVLIVAIYWTFQKRDRRHVLPAFVNLQRVSAAFMAFSHGRNDAQKPMGILALAIALYYDRSIHMTAKALRPAAA
jgi:PiT family inorganic phosphate transporter